MQTDTAIEAEIQAKGLTAPRVTPADIEANIADTRYFTAWEGAQLAYWGDSDPEDPKPIEGEPDKNGPLSLLTFCVLVLRNGFTVTGESACASPENFDAEIGRKVARANAVQKIWPLMGYALKEQLFQATQPAQAPVESSIPPHQQHALDKKIELDKRLSKLVIFIGSDAFKTLSREDQLLMDRQALTMENYSKILGMRIEGFGITA